MPTTFDEATLRAARRALLEVAGELRLPRTRYPVRTRRETKRTVVKPRHLDVAVLAIELSQAMEWIAGEHVALARELNGSTWEDVGEAFGISMQSAHHRFRGRS
jgi:hypothetical protein